MAHCSTVVLASVFLAVSAPCLAAGEWRTADAGDGHGETMVLDIDPQRSYIFECAPDAIAITYTGVTDLLDIRGEGRVGDDPGSVMPEGAAMMALFTGKGEPKFLPAHYSANPVKGWDLMLRIPKNDSALKSLEKAGMFSLFTTGYTAAIEVDSQARARFKGFFSRCRGR